ncbi:MAG: pilus assembly protein PilM [Candidatus Colwellbacteria bacterium]|nr:pilus assembly protein PilM [Candidatus Colwellbacteria bacterium]
MSEIVKLLTIEEAIAGLDIADDAVRLAWLARDKSGKLFIKELAEEPLQEDIVADGELKQPEKLTEAINKVLEKLSARPANVIVSIPEAKVYFRTFTFPASITRGKLQEAMATASGFNLPVPPEDAYIDWERVEGKNTNELLLALIRKNHANAYIKAITNAKLKIIAMEPRVLAAARVAEIGTDAPTLVILPDKTTQTFAVIQHKSVKFAHILPANLSADELNSAIKRFSDFSESTKMLFSATISAENLKLPEKFAADQRLTGKAKEWLGALGAALRGLIPRSDDELISLMAVGTETAYEEQKRLAFIRLVSNVITGVSIIFSAVFLGSWALLAIIQEGVKTETLAIIQERSVENIALEKRVLAFNSLTGQLAEIDSTSPRWSRFLETLRAALPAGITITKLTIGNPTETLVLEGKASTREILSEFRKTLEESEFATEVEIPIQNLELRTNIPFNVRFKVKNPQTLY